MLNKDSFRFRLILCTHTNTSFDQNIHYAEYLCVRMAGIYFHIPFCRKACHYCDFHFSTNLNIKNEMIQAMMHEVSMRKTELGKEPIKSIYFGGGTPSFVQSHDIGLLLEQTRKSFQVDPNAEITLEANPEDINEKKASAWLEHGVNRLSIGIQSFNNHRLQWMNRQHSANDAIESILLCQDLGFENINADLIYGIPDVNIEEWKSHVKQLLRLEITHISAYNLTVEEGTALHHMVEKGKTKNVSDEQSYMEFMWLMDYLNSQGWEHYEISNFCKRGYMAVHNTNYWKQKAYLGIGPSAHSYHNGVRSFNVRNNHRYVDAITEHQLPSEKEVLSDTEKINEAIMLGLRTSWGVNLRELRSLYGLDVSAMRKEEIQDYIGMGHLKLESGSLFLTKSGKALADRIASDLFLFEDEPKQYSLFGI
jgi:oxygen-independent coproporphyrinogen-3 oxidase